MIDSLTKEQVRKLARACATGFFAAAIWLVILYAGFLYAAFGRLRQTIENQKIEIEGLRSENHAQQSELEATKAVASEVVVAYDEERAENAQLRRALFERRSQ